MQAKAKTPNSVKARRLRHGERRFQGQVLPFAFASLSKQNTRPRIFSRVRVVGAKTHHRTMERKMKSFVLIAILGFANFAFGAQSNLPLDQAAREGQLLEVKRLLANGADPNEINKWGTTALTGASTYKSDSQNHVQIVRYLLSHGAAVNKQVADGTTALHEAAFWGHLGTATILLEAGADANLSKENGFTPLISAASQGHEGIVKLLLKSGARANEQTRSGNTALHVASGGGHESIVKLLIAAGAKRDLKNKNGAISVDVRDQSKSLNLK
ncbi:hypothetical protein LPB72_17530 [Hydrogenophaga crassostreae]|uniref:Uncharacterized protein n=2 Tax=Hydrogenophaga crassostreae TaxID=1763535 RepID=A0A167GXA3_9BURK|nr:hypothetical protein LPB072_08035 [Hydrogenophaga crassostreae]OAD39988.1 hypothetical protein LPB72_17530 [Hydrogenophaga crassostreae]